MTPTRSLLPILAALTLTSACKKEEEDPFAPSARPDAALRRLASCDDLRDHLGEALVEQALQSRYSAGMWRGGVPEASPDIGHDDSADAGAPPSDFTDTNVQEAGVDEIDLVKSTGTHMFVAQDAALHVVKSWPAASSERLATIDLDGWARGLFLAGDHLAVFTQIGEESLRPPSGDESRPGSGGADIDGGYYRWGWGATRIDVFDISDPADPIHTRRLDLTGDLVNARMIDGNIYMVNRQYLTLPDSVYRVMWEPHSDLPELDYNLAQDDAVWDAHVATARAAARPVLEGLVSAALANVDPSDLMPLWRTGAPDAMPSPDAMMSCGDLYAPNTLSPWGMLTVSHFDPAGGAPSATGIISDGWQMYASQSNLYIAQTSSSWWGFESDGVSHIHKFSLDPVDGPDYLASGEIDGWLYDQFAMSEHEGYLRAVSTDFGSGWWWNEIDDDDPDAPANHVFVLEDDGAGRLEVVGHVGGIAPNERIMSARLMGEKGYMVTFRLVDPLFTLDLSDPTDPRVVGELKMPGYSAYLHPMGPDHLLAVGMDGLDTGELTGVAITIFDVSDMANPVIAHQHVLDDEGWSWSEALWDHHAFTYHRGVLTIPAFTEHYDHSTNTWSGFSGAIAFSADATDGLAELGRVDHRDLVADSDCLQDLWYGWGDCSWQGAWYAQVRRTRYVEDKLYTISNYGVKVNELESPEIEIARVLFFPAE